MLEFVMSFFVTEKERFLLSLGSQPPVIFVIANWWAVMFSTVRVFFTVSNFPALRPATIRNSCRYDNHTASLWTIIRWPLR